MAHRRHRSDSNNSDHDAVAYIVAEPLDLDPTSSIVYPTNPTVLDSPCTPGRPVASAWPISDPLPLEVNAMPLEDIEDSGDMSFSGSGSFSARSTGVAAGEAVIRRVNIGGGPVNVVGNSDILQASNRNFSSNSNNRRRIATAEPEVDTTIRRVNIAGGPVNIVGPSDLLRDNESSGGVGSRPERRRTFGHDGDYDRFRRTATSSGQIAPPNRLERPSSHVPSRYQVQSLNIGGERVNILTLTPDEEDEDDVYNFGTEHRTRSSHSVPSSVTVAAQRDALRAGARNRTVTDSAPIDTAIRTVTIGGGPVNIVGGYNAAYNTMPTATRTETLRSRGVSNTEPVVARAYTELYDSRPVQPVVRRVNIGGQPVNILQPSDQITARDRLPSFNDREVAGRISDAEVHQLFERRTNSLTNSDH